MKMKYAKGFCVKMILLLAISFDFQCQTLDFLYCIPKHRFSSLTEIIHISTYKLLYYQPCCNRNICPTTEEEILLLWKLHWSTMENYTKCMYWMNISIDNSTFNNKLLIYSGFIICKCAIIGITAGDIQHKS